MTTAKEPSVNLLVYGAPGSGKGTQANILHGLFGIPQIATGEMLRSEIQSGSELGRSAQTIVASGGYVSDDLMIAMVRDRLSRQDCASGFVMDGFPRTVAQTAALDRLMAEMGKQLDRVIYLKVPIDELLLRLSGRLVCPICQRTYPPSVLICDSDRALLVQREDDLPEAIIARIAIYLEKTVPLLDHYRGRNLVSEIDGRGTIEEVSQRIVHAATGVGTAKLVLPGAAATPVN